MDLLKADTHEGFCSRSMLQGQAPGAKLLHVYQRFHGYTLSSGAEFPPRKMLHDMLNTWEQAPGANNAPFCVLTRAK